MLIYSDWSTYNDQMIGFFTCHTGFGVCQLLSFWDLASCDFWLFPPTLKFLDMLDNIKGYIHKAIVKESTNKYVLWNSQIWKLLYFSERNLFKMFPWEKQRQSSKKKFSGSEFLKYQLKIDILFFLLIYLLKSLKLFLMTLL